MHFCIIDEAHVFIVDEWQLFLFRFDYSPDPATPSDSEPPRTRVHERKLCVPLEKPYNPLVRCAFQSQPVSFPDCSPPFTRDATKTLLAVTFYPQRPVRPEEHTAHLLLIPTGTLFSIARHPTTERRVPWAAWGAAGARLLTFRGERWLSSMHAELDVAVAGAQAAVRARPAVPFQLQPAVADVLFLECHAHARAGGGVPARTWDVSRAELAAEGVSVEGEDEGGGGGLPLRATRRRIDLGCEAHSMCVFGVGDVFGLMVRVVRTCSP